MKIEIKPTQNPSIVKFEFPDFIANSKSYEFKNIDDTKNSPLAKQLFYLPFVKTVYISGNFIAIEKYSIVEWPDVQEEIAKQIENFVKQGGIILEQEPEIKQNPITIYSESTPNPNVMKFVANKILATKTAEFKNIDESESSPLATALFEMPPVKEIFIDENYISVTKFDRFEWIEIGNDIRGFIREFIANGGIVLDDTKWIETPKQDQQEIKKFDTLDVTSQQIINILEEYVKPAVQADGGNILFESFNAEEKKVKVILQGACNGCPSSSFTLKNGIENMLKQMLDDEQIRVEAING
jgi:Fe-S cluster biogenesis protein NfuA